MEEVTMTGIMMVTARVWTRGHWCWSPLVSGPGVGTHLIPPTSQHPSCTIQRTPASSQPDTHLITSHIAATYLYIFYIHQCKKSKWNILTFYKLNIMNIVDYIHKWSRSRLICTFIYHDSMPWAFQLLCESVAVLQNISIKSLCFGFKMQHQLTC